MKTALLIIDVQKALFKIPNEPIYQEKQLISNIGGLIDKARKSMTPIVYVQHATQTGGFMEPNTPGWEIHSVISPQKGDIIVSKRTPDSFHETVLKEELDKNGIGRLVITGLQTDYCIDTSCRRAFSLGYEAVLVSDAHSTINSKVLDAEKIVAHHNNVLGSWFCELKSAEEIEFE